MEDGREALIRILKSYESRLNEHEKRLNMVCRFLADRFNVDTEYMQSVNEMCSEDLQPVKGPDDGL